MASRLQWGANGGDTLGDVKAALAGRAFGDVPVTYAISPAKTVVDASAGDVFTFKMPATSVVKIGNPTNYDVGTEITFLVSGITSFGTIVWDTLYVLNGAFATFSTAKSKSIAFKYVAAKSKFVQIGPGTAPLSLAV
jgi:hypothetical protein